MDVTIPIKNTLFLLSDTILQLTNQQYQQPCSQLSGGSIGQHCRHIIELFKELLNGYEIGTVDYEKRQRDLLIETNIDQAIFQINDILNSIQKPDKYLQLYCNLGQGETEFEFSTNYFRELFYNLEHSVHHMALIRIGIQSITNIEIPESFGVAAATIQYRRNQCAQ
ncbi:MAG: hypothetical protein CFE25_16155 [Chitinophagaceae bacterium BSSC1]|nr:MAG: hypothetical protein CFE25_16155 [Chitinophagaceae bacterium BSSC1]